MKIYLEGVSKALGDQSWAKDMMTHRLHARDPKVLTSPIRIVCDR